MLGCLQFHIQDLLALADMHHGGLIVSLEELERGSEVIVESVGGVLFEVDILVYIRVYFIG